MKIKVPDEIETFTEGESKSESPAKESSKTFEDKIKDILQNDFQISPKFVVDDVDEDNPEFKLKLILKFTELCREQIIPRHLQAADAIEIKQDELRIKMMSQQKEVEYLLKTRQELQLNMQKLGATKLLVDGRHQDLSLRVEEVLRKLQDKCSNKTLAEKKMADELVDLNRKAENLKVRITDTSSKMSYYTSQVQTQTNIIKKRTKPLYLDKNRQMFMKECLKEMKGNLEDLVNQIKKLEKHTCKFSGEVN